MTAPTPGSRRPNLERAGQLASLLPADFAVTATINRSTWLGLEASPLAEAESAATLASTTPASPVLARAEVTIASLPRVSVTDLGAAGGSASGEAQHGDAEARQEFRVTGRIGSGGMGVVDEVEQRSLGRRVAMKRVRAPASPERCLALVSEARITGFLEHPNVVPVHALGRDDRGLPLMVMKRVEGEPWDALLERQRRSAVVTDHAVAPLSPEALEEALRVTLQVCQALEFAHSRGIVHRDIKPENVLVGEFGEVYLVDWGIAVRLHAPRTSSGVMGTPGFMAPEMLEGDESLLDARTDVYLLGATLHAVLTGRPRHSGAGVHAVLVAASRSEPFEYPTSVPEELAAICNRATHADPERRFASMAELSHALGAFLRHRDAVAIARSAGERLAEAAQLAATGEFDGPTATLLRRRLAESRFGFAEALRAWPGFDAARRGELDSVTLAARWELAQGNLEGAEGLLAELQVVPLDPGWIADPSDRRCEHSCGDEASRRTQPLEELRAAVEALRARRARQAEDAAAFEWLRFEQDAKVASRTRALVVLGIGAFVASLAVLNGVLRATGVAEFSYGASLRTALAVIVVALVTVWLLRRRVFRNQFNRRVVRLVLVMAVVSLVCRCVAYLAGVPLLSSYALEWVAEGGVSAVAGTTIQRAFLGPAVLLTAAGFAAAVWPTWGPALGSASMFASSLWIAWRWWPRGQVASNDA